jgi:hypothetical protein
MSLPGKILRVVEERRFTERLIRQFAPRVVRALQRPSVGNFLSACSTPRWQAAELLDVLLGSDWRTNTSLYEAEFSSIAADLAGRYMQRHLPLPVEHRMDEQSLFVLYAWIRQRKPRMVVETGVLNGHSTVFLLNAALKNHTGEVHSVDIRPDVGGLINDAERSRWSFHLLPPYGSRRFFHELVSGLAPIDLFFHDSQHSYDWQMLEYNCAYPALSLNGLLGSDDADGNYAFLDFANSVKLVPEILMDSRKVTGFIPLPSRQA